MTDAATAIKKIEIRAMISAVQDEADHYRGWADSVSDGNRAGLLAKAAVLEQAATVVANAELAVGFARSNGAAFRKWRDGRGG